MGVLVDMDMPKNCNDCCISIFGCICGKPISDIKEVDTLHERLPDCPLHELPKGKWIRKPSIVWWECSNCGQVMYSETKEDRLEFHKFCSRCGAEMEVEE